MTYAEYSELEGVNWSTLKELRRSPLHYRKQRPRPMTESLAIGQVTHVACLEPHRLPLEVAVWEGGMRAGKKWKAFASVNAGKTIVKASDYERCLEIGAAVRAHPVAGPIFKSGVAETAIRWVDPETGIACKARLDWQPGPSDVVDLKTARLIDDHRFAGQAWALGYFHQMAFYRAGLAVNAGCKPEAIARRIVAVENTWPHDVAVYEPDDDSMDLAATEIRALLVRLAECRESDEWPGAHTAGVKELRAPVYVLGDDYEFSVTEGGETNA